jgi:hypothetical protein
MPPVTCHLRYEIDPSELDAFKRFAKRLLPAVRGVGLRAPLLRPDLDA